MAEIHCRYFIGDRPCGKNSRCDSTCRDRSVPAHRVLVISLEALGAVLRSTVILEPLKKKYPKSHITWVTKAPADQLLCNNPWIDRVLTLAPEDILQLAALDFDVALVVDKSLTAAGLLAQTSAKEVFGFRCDRRSGAILPATAASNELWQLGLDNHKKFFINQKPETQLLTEALELGPFVRTPYSLILSSQEQNSVSARRNQWSIHRQKKLVGINTGASPTLAHKNLTVSFQRQIIGRLQTDPRIQIVLLGGHAETVRNREIADGFSNVTLSPTDQGVRDGLLSVAACDVILTGDSLGMHMAIALQKWTVAWFGPTCAQDIDLYDRGVKIKTEASCSPCWKRSCDEAIPCSEQVAMSKILSGVYQGLDKTPSDVQVLKENRTHDQANLL